MLQIKLKVVKYWIIYKFWDIVHNTIIHGTMPFLGGLNWLNTWHDKSALYLIYYTHQYNNHANVIDAILYQRRRDKKFQEAEKKAFDEGKPYDFNY